MCLSSASVYPWQQVKHWRVESTGGAQNRADHAANMLPTDEVMQGGCIAAPKVSNATAAAAAAAAAVKAEEADAKAAAACRSLAHLGAHYTGDNTSC
jgi:hypothetical protein